MAADGVTERTKGGFTFDNVLRNANLESMGFKVSARSLVWASPPPPSLFIHIIPAVKPAGAPLAPQTVLFALPPALVATRARTPPPPPTSLAGVAKARFMGEAVERCWYSYKRLVVRG